MAEPDEPTGEFLRRVADVVWQHCTPEMGLDEGDVDRLRTIAGEPTARDAIVALLKMERDKCSNGAWADELCRHFGYNPDVVRAIAYPALTASNQPRLGSTSCE